MATRGASFSDRSVVGLTEPVTIIQNGDRETVTARIDSGATKSSIDIALASKLRLGPVVASRMVKSANGARLRPMVEVTLLIARKELTAKFTLADRSHMKYKVLIGQNILERGFLIDPCKER